MHIVVIARDLPLEMPGEVVLHIIEHISFSALLVLDLEFEIFIGAPREEVIPMAG